MTLTAPSEGLAPIAEYPFPAPLERAQVARHSIIPVMPREHTLAPCPELPDRPVHPLAPERFELLQLPAESLGDRFAPHRKLARPRLPTDMRQAEDVKGLRFALSPPLAPVAGPPPTFQEAGPVRVQCAVEPVEALPQVASQLLGGVCVFEADREVITVAHDDDISSCMPAAPLGSPEVKDIVLGRFFGSMKLSDSLWPCVLVVSHGFTRRTWRRGARPDPGPPESRS